MKDKFGNNKRIAKNTLFLYVRMLFLMFISLYTSRVVLNALGVDDYGIYNVVGGVVAMFSVISGSLSASISRFITFELGKGRVDRLKRVFSSAITIQLCLGGGIVLLAEPIGIWFLNNKMVIPADRLIAANWVLQLSILTFFVNLISVPYNAAIIAHEKMSAFAYISIIEGVGKLLVAYLIVISPIDRLITYAVLMAIISIIIRFTYTYYCKRYIEECQFKLVFDKHLLKQMFGFAGWNFIGAVSGVLRDQGGNILINLFGGPVVNAARGIAMQVSHAITGFATNFMTAINPQITKSYASGNYEYMMSLIYRGARFSFYMLLILSLPVIINTPYILSLWLGVVPEHTVLFVRLILVFAMCESISNPLITAMLATGNIRNYQIVVGGLQLLNLPLSYILLRIGAIPEVVTMVAIALSLTCLFARLFMLSKMITFNIWGYVRNVLMNVVLVCVLSSIFPILMYYNLRYGTFTNFLLNSIVCLISTCITVYFIGCSCNERRFVNEKVMLIINKLKR